MNEPAPVEVIVIPTSYRDDDGITAVVPAPYRARCNTLEDYQHLVDGHIEHVGPIWRGYFGMFINEEGKIYELTLNPIATALAKDWLPEWDAIFGPAVLIGPGVGPGGETLPVDEAAVKLLEHALGLSFEYKEDPAERETSRPTVNPDGG